VWLGRAAGLTEDKLRHLGADPLPEGVYSPEEAAVVTYAQRSSRLEPITDELYAELARHFDTRAIMEICFTVGMSNMVNRFHATFLTDVDPETLEAVGACPLQLPPTPGGGPG
jgi:alkylhydroperoxidase family enzyme